MDFQATCTDALSSPLVTAQDFLPYRQQERLWFYAEKSLLQNFKKIKTTIILLHNIISTVDKRILQCKNEPPNSCGLLVIFITLSVHLQYSSFNF